MKQLQPAANKFSFVSDIIATIVQRGDTVVALSSMMPLAAALDSVLTSLDECEDYQNHVASLLPISGINAAGRAYDFRMYERTLNRAEVAFVLAMPLESRSEEELSSARIDLLALNLEGMRQLSVGIFQNFSMPWIDFMARRGADLLRASKKSGYFLDPEVLAASIGLNLPKESRSSVSGAHREVRTLSSATGETDVRRSEANFNSVKSSRLLVQFVRFEEITWEYGVPEDKTLVLSVQLEKSDKALVVKTGGLGFVEEGCTAKLAWIDAVDKTVAIGEIKDEDRPLVLASGIYPMTGQHLQIDFVRTGDQPMHFSAKFELKF